MLQQTIIIDRTSSQPHLEDARSRPNKGLNDISSLTPGERLKQDCRLDLFVKQDGAASFWGCLVCRFTPGWNSVLHDSGIMKFFIIQCFGYMLLSMCIATKINLIRVLGGGNWFLPFFYIHICDELPQCNGILHISKSPWSKKPDCKAFPENIDAV